MSNIENNLHDLRSAIISTNFSDTEYYKKLVVLNESISRELDLLSGESIILENRVLSLENATVNLQVQVKNLEYFFGADDPRIKPEKMKNFLIEQFKIEYPEDFI
jgi:hypothetical protein